MKNRSIMKRTFTPAFVATALISAMLSGCGDQNSVTEMLNAAESVLTAAAETAKEETEAPALAEKPEAENTAETAKEETETSVETTGEETTGTDRMDVQNENMTTLQFARQLAIGWNLGNTLDAYIGDAGCNQGLSSETCWQHTKTTPAIFTALKEAGFETVRIPVSWHNHFTDVSSHTIDPEWMERVAEIVDYAVDADLYVIINIHHDNGSENGRYYPDPAHLDDAKSYIGDVWTQVAERFQDYDEHLIFEGMNEPRMVGDQNEWWIDEERQECIASIRCINELNQLFVDTVRNSGGFNTSRYLMVPGYCACPEGVLNKNFEMPVDSAKEVYGESRLILSVHAYRPYEFALNIGGTPTFSASDSSQTKEITWFMDELKKKYISKGIPVVIGEFGALKKNDNLSDRVAFSEYYVKQAKAHDIPCIWWDNAATSGGGELFGIFNRANGTFDFPEILDALMTYKE